MFCKGERKEMSEWEVSSTTSQQYASWKSTASSILSAKIGKLLKKCSRSKKKQMPPQPQVEPGALYLGPHRVDSVHKYYVEDYACKLEKLRQEVCDMEILGSERYAKKKTFEVFCGLRSHEIIRNIQLLKKEFRACQSKCYGIGQLNYSHIHTNCWLYANPANATWHANNNIPRQTYVEEGTTVRLRDIYSRQNPTTSGSDPYLCELTSETPSISCPDPVPLSMSETHAYQSTHNMRGSNGPKMVDAADQGMVSDEILQVDIGRDSRNEWDEVEANDPLRAFQYPICEDAYPGSAQESFTLSQCCGDGSMQMETNFESVNKCAEPQTNELQCPDPTAQLEYFPMGQTIQSTHYKALCPEEKGFAKMTRYESPIPMETSMQTLQVEVGLSRNGPCLGGGMSSKGVPENNAETRATDLDRLPEVQQEPAASFMETLPSEEMEVSSCDEDAADCDKVLNDCLLDLEVDMDGAKETYSNNCQPSTSYNEDECSGRISFRRTRWSSHDGVDIDSKRTHFDMKSTSRFVSCIGDATITCSSPSNSSIISAKGNELDLELCTSISECMRDSDQFCTAEDILTFENVTSEKEPGMHSQIDNIEHPRCEKEGTSTKRSSSSSSSNDKYKYSMVHQDQFEASHSPSTITQANTSIGGQECRLLQPDCKNGLNDHPKSEQHMNTFMVHEVGKSMFGEDDLLKMPEKMPDFEFEQIEEPGFLIKYPTELIGWAVELDQTSSNQC